MARTVSHSSTLPRTPFTGRTEGKVSRFLSTHALAPAGSRLLLGVSGGPDSTALAVTLSRVSGRLAFEVAIAHFDHMLRTRQEAADDADYVRRLAATLGCDVLVGSGDVALAARSSRTSREDAARTLRYAFLADSAREEGAGIVAVGHTLDDRAETVLLHILRGSGLRGLAGMDASSAWPFGTGPRLVRPLLCLTRQETQRYCREIKIKPRLDPSNELPVATRNKVRSRLMPALRGFNPRVEEALVRLADAATLDADFIDGAARSEFGRLAHIDEAGVTLPRRAVSSLHPALQARVVVLAAAAAGSTGTVQGLHIAGVLGLLSKMRGSVPVPGGLVARVSGDELFISRGAVEGAHVDAEAGTCDSITEEDAP